MGNRGVGLDECRGRSPAPSWPANRQLPPPRRRNLADVRQDIRMPLDNLSTSLRALPDSGSRDAYLRFLDAAGDAALHRNGGPKHVTGSCFVFSPGFDRVLLCFHRKGQFWVQFGGHIESTDASVAEAAQREAREESGIGDLVLLCSAIMDLDRHDLHAGFSCAAHWDVGFAAVVAPSVVTSVSDESEDVRWFPINELPAQVPAGFRARLDNVRRAAMSLAESR